MYPFIVQLGAYEDAPTNHVLRAWLIVSTSHHRSLEPSVWVEERIYCVRYPLTLKPDFGYLRWDKFTEQDLVRRCRPNLLWSDNPTVALVQGRPRMMQIFYHLTVVSQLAWAQSITAEIIWADSQRPAMNRVGAWSRPKYLIWKLQQATF